ncbi:MAG TPA: nucleotide exchange factor GrpE [Phycisphaerae bacterium]
MSEDVQLENPQTPPSTDDPPVQMADNVEHLRAEIQEYKDKYLRCLAEQQNAARRAANAQLEAVRYANANFMKALLPALDDFERLLGTEATADVQSLRAGIRLIYSNLMKALGDFNVTVVEAVGRPFDPTIHEAMMKEPSADVPEGTVLRELQKGYRLHERTLRPARVIISGGPTRSN